MLTVFHLGMILNHLLMIDITDFVTADYTSYKLTATVQTSFDIEYLGAYMRYSARISVSSGTYIGSSSGIYLGTLLLDTSSSADYTCCINIDIDETRVLFRNRMIQILHDSVVSSDGYDKYRLYA